MLVLHFVLEQTMKEEQPCTHCILFHYSDLISPTQDTQGPIDWHTYKYMLTPRVMCIQQLLVWQWINNFLFQKSTLQRSTMFFLSKNYSLIEDMFLLIRFKKMKSFLWNTKSTDTDTPTERLGHNYGPQLVILIKTNNSKQHNLTFS